MPDYKKIKNIMCRLGCTEEEAKQVIADDLAIDKGEKLFELSTEERKAETAIKRASSGERKKTAKPTIYKLDNTAGKRNKKANEVKAGLIELLSEVIKEQPACNNLEIINNEREFVFLWMGTKYKVVLSAPRS